MIGSREFSGASANVVCTIFALLLLEQLQLVSLLDPTIDLEDVADLGADTSTVADVSEIDHHQGNLHRSLGDLLISSNGVLDQAEKKAISTEADALEDLYKDDDVDDNNETNGNRNVKVTIRNNPNEGKKVITKVSVTKMEHSKEVDEPRIMKGFGMGLGKGLIG